MNKQLEGLKALTEEELPKLGAPMALVTGGKGGVGKSSIALNLAITHGRRGRRVLLLDLDLGLGDLAVMLKLAPKAGLEEFFTGHHPLGECRESISSNVDLIAGAAGSSELARPDTARRAHLFTALAELSTSYDLIIADSAAGIGPDVLAFATAADCVLCVATPDPASVTDAYGIMKALDQHAALNGIDIPTPGLVLNRVAGSAEAEGLGQRLATVTGRFLSRRPRLMGWLPESSNVRAATRQQRAFVNTAPRALAAQCTLRLAARVETLLALAPSSISF
jgi:flagellar biosynthesis protein FlhG